MEVYQRLRLSTKDRDLLLSFSSSGVYQYPRDKPRSHKVYWTDYGMFTQSPQSQQRLKQLQHRLTKMGIRVEVVTF